MARKKINNKKVKIRNKEVVAPLIPQRGKLQSLRVFASLRALRETHSCNFVPSRLSGEEKINNKKVKIRNKEVAVTNVKIEYRLSQRQTPNNK